MQRRRSSPQTKFSNEIISDSIGYPKNFKKNNTERTRQHVSTTFSNVTKRFDRNKKYNIIIVIRIIFCLIKSVKMLIVIKL